MTNRENFMRNASLAGHEWIPQVVSFSQRYWHLAREGLEVICARHPMLFPHFRLGTIDFDAGLRGQSHREVDAWGCEWVYEIDGYDGIVVGHPLADWANLGTWRPPLPPSRSAPAPEQVAARRAAGEVVGYGTEHGFFFMRLYYLRGFHNFMIDVATEDPRLDQLVETVTQYWEKALTPFVAAGIDLLSTADDLGTQTASMLGPKHFRRWLMPSYKRLFRPVRDMGAHVLMHHDGFVMDIMDEIIECGVTMVNPQDLVNGIDNLAREVRGRVCIRLDIDRQQVMPYGSPQDVRDLIREEVMKLGSPAGGLEMICGIYPPTPLENVEALCNALEEHRTYWVGR